jgi:hypothetical protein
MVALVMRPCLLHCFACGFLVPYVPLLGHGDAWACSALLSTLWFVEFTSSSASADAIGVYLACLPRAPDGCRDSNCGDSVFGIRNQLHCFQCMVSSVVHAVSTLVKLMTVIYVQYKCEQ